MAKDDGSGRWIDIAGADGKRFGGYLVEPPRMARAQAVPGLVLIQEIWGVNAHIRKVAEQYAIDGFMVIAPDVFSRMEPRVDLDYDDAGSAKAFDFMKRLDIEKADADIAATVDALKAMDGVDGRVAAVGYCMGGRLAYRAAAKAGIDCAVAYYGGGIQNETDLAASIRIPIAFHYGANDDHIPPDAVDAVRIAFAGRDNVRIDIYGEAGHGFNCWGRPSYHRPSAVLAHGRTLAFLSTHLD